MDSIHIVFNISWRLFLESSIFIIFGLLVSGVLKVFLNPGMVAKHLGTGRFKSVIKASLFGIPIPLCSCGVLPAAAALKKQGANNGAVTSFLISTPESGVDSVAITYALLDPIMTVVRPMAAFFSAAAAGIAENYFAFKKGADAVKPDMTCPVDGCCSGEECPDDEHAAHHTMLEKLAAGIRFALFDVWADLAVWFFAGLLIAGIITAIIPDDMMTRYLGGGIHSMVLMLMIGIPIYICATASTPVAAAMILKGVSPGAALVFLLAGPATNVTSLTVLVGILGKRAAVLYLTTIAVCAVLFGLAVDYLYLSLGISARAVAGQAGEMIPHGVELTAAFAVALLSVKPLWHWLKGCIEKIGLKTKPEDTKADGKTPNAITPQACDDYT